MRRFHYYTGLMIAGFITLHLLNHLMSLRGPNAHIETMNTLRVFYRNPVVETLLLVAIVVQIGSGMRLFWQTRQMATSFFDKLHRWTGLYLALFFLIHLSAVLGGRLLLHLDTNFYFGAAGLNTFPFNLFFVPYYGLAILSFFGHVAAVHQEKMQRTVLTLSPASQAIVILLLGGAVTVFIFYGLTGHFQGVVIPAEYGVLIGK